LCTPSFVANIDYVELTNSTVTLNSSNESATVNIIIIETNDTEIEQDEHFTVHLSFPGEPIPGVTLDPNKTRVEIVEFDGAGIIIIRCVHVAQN
jgi:hypothetical protein